MKNALVLVGSGHTDSRCLKIAEIIKQQLEQNRIDVEILNLVNFNIQECLGCEYCKAHQNQCIIKDYMQQIYPLINNSDYLIFVSPVYFSNIPAELKKVIDRFQLYFNLKNRDFIKPKKFLAVHMGGAPSYQEQFSAFKNTYQVLLPDINAEMADFICICNTDRVNPITDSNVMERISYGVNNLI